MKAQKRYVTFLLRAAAAILAGLGLALLLNVQAVAEVQMDVLTTKTDTYQKVTVTGRNQTDIFIMHSKGMGNVKIKDLDAETLWKLGMGPQPAGMAATAAGTAKGGAVTSVPALEPEPTPVGGMGEAALAGLPPELQAQMEAAKALQEGLPDIAISSISPVFIGVVIAVVLFFHLFFSYCVKLIVEKTGEEPGFLVWLPGLQLFPMLRAAGMSGWWFIAFFVPLLSLVPAVLWCFKIAEARGKSFWVAIFLLLPVTNLFAFLYLAFSDSGGAGRDEQTAANSPPVLLEA